MDTGVHESLHGYTGRKGFESMKNRKIIQRIDETRRCFRIMQIYGVERKEGRSTEAK
jgi:hypothetical protein